MSIETQNRISELNKIISESLKDTSVTSAGIWFKAINERSKLFENGK